MPDEVPAEVRPVFEYIDGRNPIICSTGDPAFECRTSRDVRKYSDFEGALRAIALGVCDYLVETARCPGRLATMPVEGSVILAIENMFLEGASHHAVAPGVDIALVASTAAWALFGAARRWFQTPDRIPAEEMSAKIESLVKSIFLSASP